jgi:WD40 repeat protein
LYFPVQDEGQKCIFVTETGSLIRTWWNYLSDIESDIVDMPGLGEFETSAFTTCGSLLVAASPGDSTVTLYNMRTMMVVRRLSLSIQRTTNGYTNCVAFSPDGKSFVLDVNRLQFHICEVPDLNVRRLVLGHALLAYSQSTGAVAFDPSSQFLASVGEDENVRIWTL